MKALALVVLLACNAGTQTGSAAPSAAAVKAETDAPTVLVILSSRNAIDLQGGKTLATGYFLNELMVPVAAMQEAGVRLVFANPEGTPSVMDVHSDDVAYFHGDRALHQRMKTLQASLPELLHPRRLGDVVAAGLDRYRGVFVPGGHAPMGDLASDAVVGKTLRWFHDHQRPTGLLCHGPLALLAATAQPKELAAALAAHDEARTAELRRGWPYAGYRMTVFSAAEEQTVEEGGSQAFLGGKVRFYPDDALRAAGGNVDTAPMWASHVVVDRELVTGQQPSSDEAFVKAFVPMLRAAR